MDMPSDNQSKAWARLSTLTSFVSWMCFARARCSDSENVNRLIAIPPTVDFPGDKMGSVKNIMSTYLEPFGITQYYTDYWGAYTRHLDPEEHTPGKRNTQKIERKHLTLRTRIKRLVRKTICFSKSTQMHDIVI